MRPAIHLVIAAAIGAGGCGGADSATGPYAISVLTLTLSAPELTPGQTATVTASAMTQDGRVSTGGVVSWGTSDPAVARIESSGARTATVTAVSVGPVDVTAGLDGVTMKLPVNIVASGQNVGTSASFVYTEKTGMQFIPLPKGAEGIEARAINDVGQVAGEVLYNNSASHAFLWSAANGLKDLGVLFDGTGSRTVATAISQNGQVAGWSSKPLTASFHAFRWTTSAGLVDIAAALPSSSQTLAYGINSSGQIVGENRMLEGSRPFTWSEERGMETLLLAAQNGFARANAINDAGQVAGTLTFPNSTSDWSDYAGAISWSASGVPSFLFACGAQNSDFVTCGAAFAINSNGVVAGINGNNAFVWSGAGTAALVSNPSDIYFSEPTGINDKGFIVGNSRREAPPGHFASTAFIWGPLLGYRTLAAPYGRSQVTVTGINNNDQIVGYVR